MAAGMASGSPVVIGLISVILAITLPRQLLPYSGSCRKADFHQIYFACDVWIYRELEWFIPDSASLIELSLDPLPLPSTAVEEFQR